MISGIERPAGVLVLTLALCLGSCEPPGADAGPATQPVDQGPDTTLVAELLRQLEGVEQKTLALADVLTEAEYDWRPGPGVRSGGEVFMHVAAINFVFPLFAGHEPPESTGLSLENLGTAADAYENSRSSKEDVRPELRASFENLRSAMESSAASDLDRPVTVFGSPGTVRALWIAQLGHLQEHLGQLIAYARVNGVVPPWSG
jgi:hypothetical protein